VGGRPLVKRIVIGPAVEWRTGFPYARVDSYRRYEGTPNSRRFPSFLSLDMLGYRTIEIHHHLVDIGAQVFNVTAHFNPRDVLPVAGTLERDRFINSVGVAVDGYMMIKWD